MSTYIDLIFTSNKVHASIQTVNLKDGTCWRADMRIINNTTNKNNNNNGKNDNNNKAAP